MRVTLPPGHEDEVLDSARRKGLDCRQNAAAVNDALKQGVEPDVEDRVGLLADRFEVYAMRLPGCAREAFVVSIDRRGVPTAMIHGFLAIGRAGHAARDAVIRHRGIAGAPSWET